MQPHPEAPGEVGRLSHQSFGHREGRAGSDPDAHHGAGRRIVEATDGFLGLGQDRVGVLHDRVGRKPAVLLAEVHRPSAGMEAQADLARRLDLGFQRPAHPRGEDVVMVGGQRAARQGQLGQGHSGGRPLPLLVETGPHRIELSQPAEQDLGLGPGPGHRLIHVVMGVDQSGDGHRAAAVHPFRSLGLRRLAPTGPRDHPVLDQDRAPGDLRPAVVHGDDGLAGVDEKFRHGQPLTSMRPRASARPRGTRRPGSSGSPCIGTGCPTAPRAPHPPSATGRSGADR